MLELKNPKQLAEDAHKLANSFHLVRHKAITYIPVDYETLAISPPPDPERTIWLLLDRQRLRQLAAEQFNTLFKSDSELSSFDFMVAQNSTAVLKDIRVLLVKTKEGLKELQPGGLLLEPSGEFVPNFVQPMLNSEESAVARVKQALLDWLDEEEEADSLLRHLSTCLSPGWPAVKYVLLLGDGRNGKSVLLKMVSRLFGGENVSHVTRQHIAEQNPVVCELNGKLVNIVFDGRAEYLRDSGTEKSLVAGEVVPIRKLYDSTPTLVQTNALFIEGLNREPKSSDKSSALQKRILRYHFPNVFDQDPAFERSMLTEETLGAFLHLLIEHMMTEDEFAMLKPTRQAVALKLEHMHTNSLALQFLSYIEDTDPLGVQGLIGTDADPLVQAFRSWRVKEGDVKPWEAPDVLAQFGPIFNMDRVSRRVNGKPRKVRVIKSLKADTEAFLATLNDEEGDTDAAVLDAMVDE